jgi:hypothetical protein
VFAAVIEELSKKVAEVIYEAGVSAASPVLGISCAVEALLLFLAENTREAHIPIVE